MTMHHHSPRMLLLALVLLALAVGCGEADNGGSADGGDADTDTSDYEFLPEGFEDLLTQAKACSDVRLYAMAEYGPGLVYDMPSEIVLEFRYGGGIEEMNELDQDSWSRVLTLPDEAQLRVFVGENVYQWMCEDSFDGEIIKRKTYVPISGGATLSFVRTGDDLYYDFESTLLLEDVLLELEEDPELSPIPLEELAFEDIFVEQNIGV